ncbi:hypothetical protein PK28_17070 (plasmid) [Hymenobacter sp. DG25B]|uniref:DUF3592 domain-containing protein n=1 Tax=Hymenobacter sp. DG25B TaxID=1385664 RepID=UPI000540F390|nr:DUF3592 domain-containing protein [Hymenobacter sp. DG25B]AIZ65384.1 hypothetical protein PK28_17070 [Hymenobacter sp. DG25B]
MMQLYLTISISIGIVLSYGWYLKGKKVVFVQRYRLQRQGLRTEGRRVALTPERGVDDDTVYAACFTYSCAGKPYSFTSQLRFSSLEEAPRLVCLVYDPLDPTRVEIDSFWALYGALLIEFILATAGAGTILIMLFTGELFALLSA